MTPPPTSNLLQQTINRAGLNQLNQNFDHTATQAQQENNAGTAQQEFSTGIIGGKMRPVSRKNPCIHCGKASWCRTGDLVDHCNHTEIPAVGWQLKKDQTVKHGWQFVRIPPTAERNPVVIPATTYTPPAKVEQIPWTKPEIRVQHEIYRRMVSPLTTDEKQALTNRGLDEEEIAWMESIGFGHMAQSRGGFGLDQNRHFEKGIYGVDKNGFTTASSGLFIPSFRGGLITGGQVRPNAHILADLGKGERPDKRVGKYVHLGRADRNVVELKMPDTGEIPLTSYADPLVQTIYVVEGYLKPLRLYLRLKRWGYEHIAVIGAAGSDWPVSEVEVHLNSMNLTSGAQVVLLPDAGAVHNNGVMLAMMTLVMELDTCDIPGIASGVMIGCWGQEAKGEDKDPDEIDLETFRSMKTTTWEESGWSKLFANAELNYLERHNLTPEKYKKLIYARSDDSNIRSVYAGDAESLVNIYENAATVFPGAEFIQNTCVMGSGKTHAIGLISTPTIHVTADPHNAGTPELAKSQTQMPSRSGTRYLSATEKNGAGERLNQPHRGSPDDQAIEATCEEAEWVKTRYDAGIEGSPCSDCYNKDKCSVTGYLSGISQALLAPHLRLHANSLPDPSEEAKEMLADRTLFLDDVSPFGTKQHEVSAYRVTMMAQLVKNSDAFSPFVKSCFAAFGNGVIRARATGWGLDPLACSNMMNFNEIPLEERSRLIRLEQCFELDFEGKDEYIKSGSNGVRSREARSVNQAISERKVEALKAAIEEGQAGAFLGILFKSKDSIITFDKEGNMLITRPDERMRFAVQHSALTVWNDATSSSPQNLMKYFGYNDQQIVTIKSPPENRTVDNLTFVNVVGLAKANKRDWVTGNPDTNRKNQSILSIIEAKSREDQAIVGAFLPGWMDKSTRAGLNAKGILTGSSFHDSRGSNRFSGCTDLFNTSDFKKSRMALAIEFAIINKDFVDTSIQPDQHPNLAWRRFVEDSQVSEIVQSAGRFRYQRRPTEMLKIWQLAAVSDKILRRVRLQLPGITVVSEHGVDLPGVLSCDTVQHKLAVIEALLGMNLDRRITYKQIASLACTTEEVVRGVYTENRQQSSAVGRDRIKELQKSELYYLPSQRLGLKLLPIYTEEDIEGYRKPDTKAAMDNSFISQFKGYEAYQRSTGSQRAFAEELLRPIDPQKFDEVYNGILPIVESFDDDIWGDEPDPEIYRDEPAPELDWFDQPPID
jgi:hypothetical protein